MVDASPDVAEFPGYHLLMLFCHPEVSEVKKICKDIR